MGFNLSSVTHDKAEEMASQALERLTSICGLDVISNLKDLHLPKHLITTLAFKPLEKSVAVMESQGGPVDEREVIDLIACAFKQVYDFTKSHPDVFKVCSVNEAIFTKASDPKPIMATDSLACCIAMVGYDRQQKKGFMLHLFRLGASK